MRAKVKKSKAVKIRNRYNKVPQLTQDTNGKVTNSQLYTTNKSQEVSLFPAGRVFRTEESRVKMCPENNNLRPPVA